MFKPKTEKIKNLAKDHPKVIENLEGVFNKKTNIYIDYANVVWWQNRLEWHFEIKRLKQFLDSFNTINEIKFYYGELEDNEKSKEFLDEVKNCGFVLRKKPVKIYKLPIDVSSVEFNSPSVLKDFISKSLLSKFDLETIEFLNDKLKELNNKNILYIEDKKCNFDVEIGVDMVVDARKDKIENFVLWSGDSDFCDPLEQLLEKNKKAIMFSTSGKVSRELNQLKDKGLIVFEIQKIRNFICWNKEMTLN